MKQDTSIQKPTKIFVNNLDDLIREVINFEPIIMNKNDDPAHFNSPLWFRGLPQSNYSLIPRLYRRFRVSNGDFWCQLIKKETELIADFRIRNYHLIPRFPENELTWMTMMQHYGTSTRLLDWSEQLLVSLFFALDEYFQEITSNVNYLPCIWCLKPLELNKVTIDYWKLGFDTDKLPDMLSIHSSDNETAKNYYYERIFCNSAKRIAISRDKTLCYPLAIISPYNNERIRAQSGTFALFPLRTAKQISSQRECAMENLPNSNKFLRQFIILKPFEVKQELRAIGFKKSLILPELPVIADELDQDCFLE